MIKKYSTLKLAHNVPAFHGTDANPFQEFKKMPGKIVTIFGEEPVERSGFFFTPDKEKAKKFGKNVIQVLLKMNNPADIRRLGVDGELTETFLKRGWGQKYLLNTEAWELFDGNIGKDFINTLIELGYDSVIFDEQDIDGRGGKSYVVFTPEQIKIIGKTASITKQSDAFFQQEFEEAYEDAEAELIREFNRNKTIAIEESPGVYKHIVSKSPTDPKMIRITNFYKGEPSGHSDYNFSKEGLKKLIQDWHLSSKYLRKDLPDWAGFGNMEPIKTFYKLRLRDISSGTVPTGFVETRGNRVVIYDRLLSRDEIDKYELEPLGYEDSTTKFKG